MVPAATALAQTLACGRRASASSTSRTARTWRRGRRPPPARGFELSPTLQTLEPFKDSLVVVSNLRARGRTGRDARGGRQRLAERRDPEANRGQRTIACGTTIDQVLARQIGQASPFPSLEFATEDFTGYVGGCTPGYSCAYMNTIAWASPTTPLPMEINPRVAFERLFGDGGSEAERQQQPARGSQHPRRHRQRGAGAAGARSARATARGSPTTWTTCARSSAGFSGPRRSSARR